MTSQAGREASVLDGVVSLVDSLLDDFDVIELLTELTEQCVQLLHVTSAGLLLADPRGQLHLMASTSEGTRDLELFQLQIDEGPCLDCYATGELVSIADLRTEPGRWPRFVPAAAEAGFAAVNAVPMRAAGTVLGALGLFSTTAGALSRADLLVGQTLAHIATVAILQEHAPTPDAILPRLRTAVTSRIVVEQAKGFVHERLGIPLDEAFGVLRDHAHTRGMHLTEVARTLMGDREARPALIAAMTQLSRGT